MGRAAQRRGITRSGLQAHRLQPDPAMRTKLLTVIAAMGLSLALSGCLVHTHDRPSRSRSAVKSKRGGCKPSQYWDGHKCRHKGKGHGARKHDGR